MPRLERLRWRRLWPVLGAFAVLAAAGFVAGARVAVVVPAQDWLQVTSDTDAGLELVLRAPEPVRAGAHLRLPGFAAGGEPGRPVVYEQAVTIGVPGPAGAVLEVLDETRRDLGAVAPEGVPAPLSTGERAELERAGRLGDEREPVPAPSLEGPYPAAAVALGGVARLRRRDVVVLRFHPLQYRPDGGATLAGEVRVRLVFRDRARRPQPDLAGGAMDPMHAALLNATTAARWAASGAGAEPGPALRPGQPSGAALPLERLRIRISEGGIYQLRYADLKAALVPLESIDPRTFRLFFDTWRPVALYADSTPASWQAEYEMQEASIWVPGEEDASFDQDDRVVFYSLGPGGYEDLAVAGADSLAHAHHPFDRYLYAWLTWSGQPGRRMQAQDATPPDTLTGPVVKRGWHREHREEDVQFDQVDDLWYWQEVSPERPVSVPLKLDLGGEDKATGNLRIGLGWSQSWNAHRVGVSVDNRTLGQASWFGGYPDPYPHFFDYDVEFSPTSKLDLSVVRVGSDSVRVANAQFLKLDVAWQRPLVKSAGGVVDWSDWPAAGPPSVYELGRFGDQAPLLCDVTDAARPVRLVLADAARLGTGAASRWRARYAGSSSRRTQFLAVASADTMRAGDLVLRNVAPLRQRATSPDMLIVTHASLHTAAERLAEHRRRQWPDSGGSDILVVDTQDIYDNFSGGRLDPLAIRNYVKFLYRLQPGRPRLRYLLLFGDATRDPRRLSPGAAQTLVPTLEPWYLEKRLPDPYAVDDWLAEMETPPPVFPDTPTHTYRFPLPDVAVGRLAVRSLAEAERLVDKIVAYETASGYGSWRTRLLMAADDECTPRTCTEAIHTEQTEDLIRVVPPELDVVKMYLTEYPSNLGEKPQARAAFIRDWSDGCTFVNYVGHGAPRQLADEKLFLATDVPSLANGSRLPLFVAASCTVSEFDDVEKQSMCEDMVASPRGGAIGTIAATTVTGSFQNYPFNRAVLHALFQGGATARVPLGVALQLAKTSTPTGDRENNQGYVLIGDPSLPLLLPTDLASFASGADTLHTGRRDSVRVVLHAPGDTLRVAMNGQADVEVFASADESGYRAANMFIAYDLVGAPIYRGRVRVENGSCKFQFFVPVGARVGSKGRVSVYAWDDTRRLDAKGASDAVSLVRAVAEKDTLGPRISLNFPNGLTHVKTGTLLAAEIRDESGINIQGTTLHSSIYLDFDRKSEPLNVTAQFRYLEGSATVGLVSVPLPGDLEPGKHSAALLASDNLQNTSTASLDFEVVEDAVVRLLNVIAFPNPFPGPAPPREGLHFFFELTDPAEVEVRVFTSTGRQIWQHRQMFDTATQGSILWDSVDLLEDRLANGTYIYRLRARPLRAGAPTLEHTGKVVLMRGSGSWRRGQ